MIKDSLYLLRILCIIIGGGSLVAPFILPTPGLKTKILCATIPVLIIILWMSISFWKFKKRFDKYYTSYGKLKKRFYKYYTFYWKLKEDCDELNVSNKKLEDRLSRLSSSFNHVHKLTHNLRGDIGTQCQPQWAGSWTPGQIDEHLEGALQAILNQASKCLSKITGEEITACLLMPIGVRQDTRNLVFKTMLYDEDANENRRKCSKEHDGNIIQAAFGKLKPFIHNDYEKEIEQGTFVPTRSDWRDHYMSSLMTSFTAEKNSNTEEDWGVLSFDCRKKNVFGNDWRYLACTFSDALGLVISRV